jgi:hypothetical protein
MTTKSQNARLSAKLSKLTAKIEQFEAKYGCRSNKVIALRVQYASLTLNF